MAAVIKSADEIAFLSRVDSRYRVGATIEEIAAEEGLHSPGALQGKVQRIGFRFSRQGGLMLVDLLMGRPLLEWSESGDLVAAEPDPVSAA